MAILTFLLGAILIAGGLGGWLAAINLVPTEMGLLYAVSGVILLSSGGVVWAIAALIARLDRIAGPMRKPAAPPAKPATGGEPDDLIGGVEAAIAQPEPAPLVVGHYVAGSAKYKILSDGTIETETDAGPFRFGSMGEFKSYLAGRQT